MERGGGREGTLQSERERDGGKERVGERGVGRQRERELPENQKRPPSRVASAPPLLPPLPVLPAGGAGSLNRTPPTPGRSFPRILGPG